MNRKEILRIAMEQSAIDAGCHAEDFQRSENVIVSSVADLRARRYLKLPFACNLISYGNNIVASVEERFRETVGAYIEKYQTPHCFETPNLHVLNDALQKEGHRICFMAEYFLPDVDALTAKNCGFALRMLGPSDFESLYLPEWSNALCKDRRELDRLGIGAYDGEALVGLAGCSADCDTMWQIGVDVLPAYRGKGIATALTSRLALAVFEEGKVPFYCAAWSNIPSVRNAIASGFRPAWVEMTAKPDSFVNAMNEKNG